MKVGLLGPETMSTLERMIESLRKTIERLLPHLTDVEHDAVAEFARSWVALAGEIASTEHPTPLTESDPRPTLKPRSILYKPIQPHT